MNVPGFRGLTVEAHRTSDGKVCMNYSALADELLNSGACIEDMVRPSSKRGPAGLRVDGDGDPFWRNKWFVRRDGQFIERFRIR